MKLIAAISLTICAVAANAANLGTLLSPAAKTASPAPLKCGKGFAKVKVLKVTKAAAPDSQVIDYRGKTDFGGVLMSNAEVKDKGIAVGVAFCMESPDEH